MDDNVTSFDEPKPPRKRPPRWLIPLLIVDAIVVAAVTYYIYQRVVTDTPDVPIPTTQPVGEVRGALINGLFTASTAHAGQKPPSSPPVAASASADGWDAEDWRGDEWDESEWADMPETISTDAGTAAATPGASLNALFGGGEWNAALPRPTITKPLYADFVPINFDDIGSWEYQRVWPPPPSDAPPAADPIPAEIRAWNGRKVAIAGFMQPVRIDRNRVSQFMLMRSQALCCFGASITLVDWVEVNAPTGESFEPMLHKPITVLGTLDVGEEKIDGFTISLFRMTPDHVLPPGESP